MFLTQAKPHTYLEMPWPASAHKSIWPLFMPYAGCERRCIFCSQEEQSGTRQALRHDFDALLHAWENELATCPKAPELAFFGGTFTNLDEERWQKALSFARRLLDAGKISAWRCSTRPDRLAPGRLKELKNSGCETIELGIQSFSDLALLYSRRGYRGTQALESCYRTREAGFALTAQLLGGMPGGTMASFLEDVEIALQAGIKEFRLFPCLVLENTLLAELWRQGVYQPWDMDTAINTLARAFLLISSAGGRVIRMGLSPQGELLQAILRGPWHPALGSRVQGRALWLALKSLMRQAREGLLELHLPRKAQGYYRGWQGELNWRWQKLIANGCRIIWHDRNMLAISAPA